MDFLTPQGALHVMLCHGAVVERTLQLAACNLYLEY